MKKKKVCMIVYTLYPFDSRVRREAETLAACGGFEVTVLCLKEASKPKSYLKEKVRVKELNIKKYVGNSMHRYLISYVRFLTWAFFICSGLFIRKNMDIVHIHNMPNFLVLAAIIPKLFGKKIVLDMHDSVPDTFQAKFRGETGLLYKALCFEEKLSAWMSDLILCVNHVQKEVTVKRGIPSEKIYVSMNVPDHHKFSELKKQDNDFKKHGRFNLVYHGTITERLGIDLAIETTRILKKRIPEIELHLWGKGDYVDFVSGHQKKLGNDDIVFFHGAVPVEELSIALNEMDVGIIPNRKNKATELMLPVKMMEYIALGIPVVAPKLKAIQYYFNEEMVTFFEPENIDEMATAIFEIYQDSSRIKAQVEKAKEFLEQYGWKKQSKEFIDYYMRI